MTPPWQKFDYLKKNEDVWEEKIAYKHMFSISAVHKAFLIATTQKSDVSG